MKPATQIDEHLSEIATAALDVDHAAGLLASLADGCGEKDEVTDTEWYRALYLARRLAEHALTIRENVSGAESLRLADRKSGDA